MTGEVKRRLQVMDNYDFEHFVADLWDRMGWETTVSQASMDAGIDVIATKETPYPQKKVIQAKRYGENTTVGGPDIQQYASLKQQVEGADSVIVVTTSEFTSSAHKRARELNVKLVNGDRLVQLINKYDARDLVSKYVSDVREGRSDPSVADGGATQTSKGTTKTRKGGRIRGALRRVRALAWHQYVAYAIGGVIVLFFAIGILAGVSLLDPIVNLLAVVWFLLLVSIPIAWYLDMRRVQSQSEWEPTAWLYLLGGIILPFIAFPLYYYRRWKRVGL
ncbi:restriction endonuclease [Natronorubrum thiooxidans]|uniref:Restriction endonuclease n=1 Tax=Natronorubrum thiooxidans TaxID=308853 RepID=A0A1N7HB29_9EURY|nr:restriction endonuclease [Natronorubrum thiooxidans]SIS21910.1 Restriction endonuclease [Natronorubrum thiooxidans]